MQRLVKLPNALNLLTEHGMRHLTALLKCSGNYDKQSLDFVMKYFA